MSAAVHATDGTPPTAEDLIVGRRGRFAALLLITGPWASNVVVLPQRFSGELISNLGNMRKLSIQYVAIVHSVAAVCPPSGMIMCFSSSARIVSANSRPAAEIGQRSTFLRIAVRTAGSVALVTADFRHPDSRTKP